MLFLILLGGAFDTITLNQVFFIEADTRGIPNAPDGIARWTLYNTCAENTNGPSRNCRGNIAAYPFDPVRNFCTTENVPREFIQNQDTYFYLTRFLYVFYVLTLICSISSLAAAFFVAFTRIAIVLSASALFFSAFAASIMSACFVKAQQAFLDNGRFACVGLKAFAYTWTCVALLTISTIITQILYSKTKDRHRALDGDRQRQKRGQSKRWWKRQEIEDEKRERSGGNEHFTECESHGRF